MDERIYLTKKNKFSFAAGGFGQNLIISTVNSYLLFFLTDISVIGYTAASMIMLAARIFDAFNDPIMGVIADKTRTKMGKLRPYLLAAPIPLGLITCLLFIVPEISVGGRIAYAAVFYILWGLIYTVGDIPFWGMASALTPNPKERVSFITFSRLFHSIGGALPYLTLPIASFIFKDLQDQYLAIGLFAGIFGGALFLLTFFGTEERYSSDSKAPSLKECFKYLGKNRPLLVVVIANVLGFGRAILTTAGMYIATYLVEGVPSFLSGVSNSVINTVLLVGFAVSGFFSMIFTPALTKKYNYRSLQLACCVLGVVGNVVFLILGLTIGYNFWMILLVQIALGMAYGLTGNINYAMIAESVDYLEWKEGKRTEGVSLSMQTFMNKMMSALQFFLIPLVLGMIGFVEKAEGATVYPEQTPEALKSFFLMLCILPIVCWLISGIVWIFYDFVGKKREDIYEELTERRRLAEEENAEPATELEIATDTDANA